MRSKRNLACRALFTALLAVLLLPACGGPAPQEEAGPYTLRVSLAGSVETLDPAQEEEETVIYHLYENLLRWEDDGAGWGKLAPGQAETWTVDTDYAGNAAYTFTLREGACWSDGKPVTAADFVTAWQRLADPANALPHRELLSAVSGYGAVQETGDVSALAVSAVDARTLTVTLDGSPAWFLAEVCAGAHTMPLREDLRGSWAAGTVTNGPYTAAERTPALTRLERSVTYYDAANIGPEELTFVPAGDPAADYAQLASGELDLVTALPDSVLQEAAEDWLPEPETRGYGVLLNPAAPPFDNPDVREAFRLAVDPAGLALGPELRPAAGLAPCGVADYGERPEEAEAGRWDFRIHSAERVTMPEAGEYEENCRLARRLLAQAGYPQGDGLPLVEYVYVDAEMNAAAAQALRRMWQEQLGVPVVIRGLSQEAYDALLTPAPAPEDPETGETEEEPDGPAFQLAGWAYSAAYSDAAAVLSFWESGNGANPTGYANAAFDLVMEAARTAAEPDVRDALLHDAEALLLKEGPVIPLYYSGGSYALAEKWSELYRNPDGVYFLYHIAAAS